MTHFKLRSSLFAAAMILFSIAAQAQVGIRTATPGSTLDIRGSFAGNYTRVTTTPFSMIDTSFYAVYAGTTDGTINLPAAISGTGNFLGRMYYFKNTTAAYSLTIDAAGTETIDDSLTLTIPAGYGAIIVNTGLTGATAATWEVVSFGATSTATITNITSGVSGYANCLGQNTAVVPIVSVKTGRTWMDRNLGASRRALVQLTDYQSYGCLFQWGRGNDGHASMTWTGLTIPSAGVFYRTSYPTNVTTTILSTTDVPGTPLFIFGNVANTDWRNPQNASLWQGVNGINNPCPAGYRLPTSAEWVAEYSGGGFSNASSAWAALKLPMPDTRSPQGSLDKATNPIFGPADYWTSTVSGNQASVMELTSTTVAMSTSFRAQGNSVRCIMN